MPDGSKRLRELTGRLEALKRKLVAVGELRPGALTRRYRKCGKPSCHCADPKSHGHGPSWSLTRAEKGKTLTKIIPPSAVEKTREQITEHRRFRDLAREFVEVSEKICDARLAGGERSTGQRSRKGIETRARLLKAAKSVFEDDRFHDARISDITKRAGVSHGSFYNYFESKEEIFRAVAGAVQEQFGTHSVLVHKELLSSLSGPRMREWFLESNRRFLEEYRNEARIMGVIEQVSRYDDAVRAARSASQKLYTERAEAAIRGLQRMGLVDKRLDPLLATLALTALITKFAEMWFVEGQVVCSFERGVEQIAIMCMNTLVLKDTPEIR